MSQLSGGRKKGAGAWVRLLRPEDLDAAHEVLAFLGGYLGGVSIIAPTTLEPNWMFGPFPNRAQGLPWQIVVHSRAERLARDKRHQYKTSQPWTKDLAMGAFRKACRKAWTG